MRDPVKDRLREYVVAVRGDSLPTAGRRFRATLANDIGVSIEFPSVRLNSAPGQDFFLSMGFFLCFMSGLPHRGIFSFLGINIPISSFAFWANSYF